MRIRSPILYCLCTDGDVKLEGGTDHCRGKLWLKSKGTWKKVSHRRWTNQLSSVVCRQLNCGTLVSTQHIDGSSESLWKRGYTFTCDPSASSLRECGEWDSTTAYKRVEVVCSGKLTSTLKYSAFCATKQVLPFAVCCVGSLPLAWCECNIIICMFCINLLGCMSKYDRKYILLIV